MQYQKKTSKDLLKHELRDYALIFLISTTFTYFTCQGCFNGIEQSFRNVLHSFIVWAFLWKGNSYITIYLSNRVSWTQQPLRRFIVGMVSMIIYTTLIMFLLQYFFFLIGFTSASIAPFGAYLFSIGITFFISLVLHCVNFLQSWRKAELDMEKIKNERLASQYEALKNQVNPHFLFNSLNALTSLVYDDQDQAADFIQKLSKVYRYVLDNRDKETVSLAAEMEFVKSYLFLQKIRYGDNLQFNIEIPEVSNFRVAPLSIQMLVENAIKHNIISTDEPLKINIEMEAEHYLVTRNKLQVKNIINEFSGIGLENIKARYLYFTKRPVIVDKTAREFIVKLPLIKHEQHIHQEQESLVAV